MAANAGKQQHRDAAAGDQHIDTLCDQWLGLFGVFSFHILGQIVIFVGAQDLPRFERHGVDPGDAVFQSIFADLMLEPGDIAWVDRHDPGSLSQLAGVQHRRFAQGDDGDVDNRAALVQSGVLEVADDEGVVAFAFGLNGVADDLTRSRAG
jgi:hypothetical protein